MNEKLKLAWLKTANVAEQNKKKLERRHPTFRRKRKSVDRKKNCPSFLSNLLAHSEKTCTIQSRGGKE